MDGWMEERPERWKAAWQSDMSDGGEEREGEKSDVEMEEAT